MPLPQALTMGSPDEVEASFYDAMQRGDLEAMMALWADEADIACIHPGGGRHLGPAAVRASFAEVFAQGGVDVQPVSVQRLPTREMALHHVVERVRLQVGDGLHTGWALATQAYLLTPRGWRLVLHHASPGGPPGSPPDEAPAGSGPTVLH